MHVWKVLELFLIQPLVWIGLIRCYLAARHRVHYERLHFRSAIDAHYLEVRNFFKDGLLFGVIATVVSLALGLVVSPIWVVIYELLAVLSLLLIPTRLTPVTVFGLSWLVYWVLNPSLVAQIGARLRTHGVISLGLNSGVIISGFLILGLGLAATAVLLRRRDTQLNSPQIRPDQRGKRIVRYRWQQLLVIPVGVLIPGDWLHATLPWWPVFQVGTQQFSVLLLPLLLGASVQVYKQQPQVAWRRLAKDYWLVAAVSVIFALAARWLALSPQWLIGLLGVLVVLLWGSLLRHRYHDQHQQFWFSDTDQGVRVIGVRPKTPAAKLNLSIGDVILECNRQPVHSEAQFYAAILTSPTYVHLKVRNVQQELIITETAIYSGAPHELGIVLFTDQED
ncbi:PDZ domain-containing protein [Lactiplantibacillus sp. WILCCON 0030]|uniref:PDZ domain-containing protein n=1 Tax=Lactiplantibacillus brownii TaxID=3069269 RepID=A0ABU1A6J4_9LACO|nr:PDZ domain-containing protein [Lactiplantibacillus brownii]MDQ7936572.1 PDZ domain-containing protein [Lactiplantibacillus brownii]